MSARAPSFGIWVALIGGLFASAEFILKWYMTLQGRHYDPSWWPVMLGVMVVFLGGYLRNSVKAKDAGNFVVTSAVRLIRVVRTGKGDDVEEEIIVGRRASDSIAVVTPVPPATVPPVEVPASLSKKGEVPPNA